MAFPPLPIQIKLGSRVCVRTTMPNRPGFVFVEGAIVDVQNDTKAYTVQLSGNGKQEKMYNVKRAHIRLLRPPWWDELNDAGNEAEQIRGNNEHTTYMVANNKKPHLGGNSRSGASTTSAIMFNNASSNRGHLDGNASANSRLKYASRVDAAGAPLQLHQVIPTIQVRTASSSLHSSDVLWTN